MVSVLMMLNGTPNFYTVMGIIFAIFLVLSLRNYSKDEIYELLGITWLQNRFKNNEVIMDMTKE